MSFEVPTKEIELIPQDFFEDSLIDLNTCLHLNIRRWLDEVRDVEIVACRDCGGLVRFPKGKIERLFRGNQITGIEEMNLPAMIIPDAADILRQMERVLLNYGLRLQKEVPK